jgi:hypothetical protein
MSNGIFKSTDGGESWATTTLTDSTYFSVAIDPVEPNNVYVGTKREATIHKSTDDGATWTATALPDTAIITIAIAPSSPKTLFVGTEGVKVYKSTDGGLTWVSKSNGLPLLFDTPYWRRWRPQGVNCLVVDRFNPNLVYSMVSCEGGIYKTTDGGENWQAMNEGYEGYPLNHTVVIDPTDRKTLYAGSIAGVWSYTASTTPEPAPDTNQAVAFPNPARGNRVTFAYLLEFNAEVTLRVYGLSKELVKAVVEQKSAGDCSTVLDITDLRPGVYFFQITTKDATTDEIKHWKRQKLAIIR